MLVHLQEISYSRVNHPDEIFNIGEKHNLKVISIDKENFKLAVQLNSCLLTLLNIFQITKLVSIQSKS